MFYATYIAGQYDFLKPEPGDVVVDAGANVGDYAIKAAQEVLPDGVVLAIEPNPTLLPYLEHNIQANGLANVWTVACAVGEPGWAELGGPLDGGTGTTGRSIVYKGQGGSLVQVRTLDDILDEAGFSHADIIKMDIEGSETSALRTFSALSKVRMLAVELHGTENLQEVPRLLRKDFRLSYESSADVRTRTLHNIFSHPVQFLGNEIQSSFVAGRGVLQYLLGRGHPVPSVSQRERIAIVYGINRGSFTV